MKPQQTTLIALIILFSAALLNLLLGFLKINFPIIGQLLWGALSIFCVVAILDYLISKNQRPLKINRILPTNIILGKNTQVRLQIIATDKNLNKPIPITIGDCLPPDWITETPEIHTEVLPNTNYGIEVDYYAKANKRGDTNFGGIDIAIPSRLGLWQIIFRQPESMGKVKVLPDFADIYGSDLMSFQRWLSMVGVKRSLRRGSGQDFFQIKEFNDGDDIRHIDWKATARSFKPMVRQFQDERDRKIIFLVDCSYEMRSISEQRSLLDYSLTSMILLAYTASHHGDSVGMMTCNSNKEKFIPPIKGMSQIARLIESIYDIEPTRQTFDWEHTVEQIIAKQKRRAWIILVTTLDNHDEIMFKSLIRLKKHFPILVVGIRHPILQKISQSKIITDDDIATYIGTQYKIDDERQVIAKLAASKIPSIDTTPDKLTAEIINRYLQMKQQGVW